jgi:hypothetical protein
MVGFLMYRLLLVSIRVLSKILAWYSGTSSVLGDAYRKYAKRAYASYRTIGQVWAHLTEQTLRLELE